MDVNNLRITAFIQYSPLQNSPGPWVMDIQAKDGDIEIEESWASASRQGCVEALIEWINKKIKT